MPGYRQTSPSLGHGYAWGQRGVNGLTGRVYNERPGLNVSQRSRTQAAESSQLGEDIVMVGMVPCRLSSKLHINGRHVFGAKDKGMERGAMADNAGRLPKHCRVMSAEG
jgi:hypothetical protein